MGCFPSTPAAKVAPEPRNRPHPDRPDPIRGPPLPDILKIEYTPPSKCSRRAAFRAGAQHAARAAALSRMSCYSGPTDNVVLSCTAGSPIHQPNESLAAFAFASSISGDQYVLHQIRCVPLRLRWALRLIGAAVSQNASAVTGWRLRCARARCARVVASALELLLHGGYCSVAAAAWRLQRGGCSVAAAAWRRRLQQAAAAARLLLKDGSEHSCGCDRG